MAGQNPFVALVAKTVANVWSYLSLDASGYLKVALSASSLTGLLTKPGGGTATNIAANAATTVVKASAGVLRTVTINTKGASANVLTLYDNASAASGTKIATIDTTGGAGTLTFNCAFANGLTVALATGTAADVTIVVD